MYCSNCGTQVPDNSRFCHNCGYNLQPNDEQKNEQSQDVNSNQKAENNTSEQSKNTENHTYNQSFNQQNQTDWSSFQVNKNNNSLNIVLKVFCCIFAAIFAFTGISALFSSIFYFGSYFHILYYNPILIFAPPLSILSGIIYIITAIILVVIGFKCSKENSAGLFLALTVSCVLLIIMVIIRQLLSLVVFRTISSNAFLQFILPIICIGGVFGLLYALQQAPDFGSFAQSTGDKFSNAARSVKDAFCELIYGLSNHSQKQYNTNNQQNYNQQNYQNNFQQPPYNLATSPLKQDRNIFVFIILNIITCGIYGLYTIYSLANDVNRACDGDGQTTSGLLIFILLSIITCGIYSFYWHYAIANRIAANAPRYGMHFQEDGTSVLLWMLLGSLLCGIGYWIAYHIIFKNMNALSAAYNNRRF